MFFGTTFKMFSDDQLGVLANCLQTEYFKIGQKIIRQNTAGKKFYIISEGQCAVLKEETDAFGNLKEILLTTLKRGKCFGEVALLSHAPRMASVVADSRQTTVLSLSKADFEQHGFSSSSSHLQHKHKDFMENRLDACMDIPYAFILIALTHHKQR